MKTATAPAPILFDDFLGLEDENFERTRLIVFTGISGSGKSTAMKFLCDRHPAFSGGSMHWIWTLGKSWDPTRVSGKGWWWSMRSTIRASCRPSPGC